MQKKPAKSNKFKAILSASGQAKAAAGEPASGARRMKAGYTQVGANIPKELKREVFKRLQDEEGLTFSALVERLLENWLKSHK